MADIDCPVCGSDEHVELVERLTGSQRKLRCTRCGSEWLRGVAVAPRTPSAPRAGGRRLPQAEDVNSARLAIVEERKAEFLAFHPEPEDIEAYWAKYQRIFRAAGLPQADPIDLRTFANSSVGARIGNMSNFNRAFSEMGPERAAGQIRKVIDYLLRGDEPEAIEDRLTNLLHGRPVEMRGLKEAILTKVLCVVYPEDYIRYVVYTGEFGKRQVLREVWGLEFPDPKETGWSIGHLIRHSNDLIVELVKGHGGFKNLQHASDFIWWWVGPPNRSELSDR